MEHTYVLNSANYKARFYVKQCAEVFRQVYGGVIHEEKVQQTATTDTKVAPQPH